MRTDLENARIAKGLTQGEVAERIGRDQSEVSRYESGTRTISAEMAPKIAGVLGLSVMEVLYPPELRSEIDRKPNNQKAA